MIVVMGKFGEESSVGTLTYIIYQPAGESEWSRDKFAICGAEQTEACMALAIAGSIFYERGELALEEYDNFLWQLSKLQTIDASIGRKILPHAMSDGMTWVSARRREILIESFTKGNLTAQVFYDALESEDKYFGALHPDNLRLLDPDGYCMDMNEVGEMTLRLYEGEKIDEDYFRHIFCDKAHVMQLMQLGLDVLCFQVPLNEGRRPLKQDLEYEVFGRVTDSDEFEPVVTLLDGNHPAVIEDRSWLYEGVNPLLHKRELVRNVLQRTERHMSLARRSVRPYLKRKQKAFAARRFRT